MIGEYWYKKCPNCGCEDMEWNSDDEIGNYGHCFECGYFEKNVKKTGILDKEEYRMRFDYMEEWFKDEPENFKDDFITYQSNCLNLPSKETLISLEDYLRLEDEHIKLSR
ncbi:MAG: hypothetical protein O2950_05885 [Proteobacteria bacterium]|nr:hypothetical protein [Pseudomonadota bacterium]